MTDWEPRYMADAVSIEMEIDLSEHAIARARLDDVPAEKVGEATEWLYQRLRHLEEPEKPKAPRKRRVKIAPQVSDEDGG